MYINSLQKSPREAILSIVRFYMLFCCGFRDITINCPRKFFCLSNNEIAHWNRYNLLSCRYRATQRLITKKKTFTNDAIDRIRELHFSNFATPWYFDINFVVFRRLKNAHANIIRSFSLSLPFVRSFAHSLTYMSLRMHSTLWATIPIETSQSNNNNHLLFQCIKLYRITQLDCILCMK